MPEVNIKEIEKTAESEKLADDVERKVIGGKSYYKGKYLEKWYDNYDECVRSNSAQHNADVLKKQGLNEHGQSKEQVKKMKERADLLAKREDAMDEVRKIDAKIANLSR